jgi:type II secretory pathway component PulF
VPAFSYTALDAAGQTTTGTLTVPTRAEVYRRLESQRLTPVSVNEQAKDSKASSEPAKDQLAPTKLKRVQLILFTEELADLMDGGLQLEQALRVMHERQESPVLRRVSGRIREQIREGATFSKALQNASPSFDELYCNLSAAGEASGTLPQTLRRLCVSIQQIHELQSRVLGALVYPAFLMGGLVLLLIVFSVVLVPGFSDMLSKSRMQPPAIMQMVLAFSDFIAAWWWLGIVVAIAAFLLFRLYISRESGRRWWDRAQLDIPLFGPVLAARFYAQFAASLGGLVTNGIPLLNAMRLSAKATSNVFFKAIITKAGVAIGEGVSLSSALRKDRQLPMMLIDLIAMGEQTGRLGFALQKAATRYDKELDIKVKRLTGMVTPVVLIILFTVVTIVALAIVTSIFETMSSVRASA